MTTRQTTVDDRPALIVFMNEKFESVAQKDATVAKVIFTDEEGGSMFMKPNADEDED